MTDNAVTAFKRRRQRRMDAREWNESAHLRDKDGKFTSSGSSEVPEKIQKVLDKSYYSRNDKIEEITKVLGRMRIGTKFNITDDRGVMHKFEKKDKGDTGWEEQIKVKGSWSKGQQVPRSLISAMMLQTKK